MRRLFLTLLFASVSTGANAAPDLPSASDILKRMGFPPEELQQVLAGELVQNEAKFNARDDLAIWLAFLVRVPPEKFEHDVTGKRFVFRLDSHTLGGSAIEGNGSLADFSGLTLSAAERRFYTQTGAGGDVNLSSDELAALHALDSAGPDVDLAMKKILLARYRAYRAKGLAGILPYDRGDGKRTEPGVSLRLDSESAQALTGFDSAFGRFLLDYPNSTLPGLAEKFYWLRYEAHGEPVLVLTHAFSAPVGKWMLFCQRQFYVSRGYNTEQAIAVFIPVSEGTLVAYLNHTATDQIVGFGGSARRAIGEHLMITELSGLFEKLRKAAAKPR